MVRISSLTRALMFVGSLGFLLAGQTSALAGLKVGPGGLKVIGDPYIDYIFDVSLDPGSSFKPGDYFIIDNVVGIDKNPLHSEPGDGIPNTYAFGTTFSTPKFQAFPPPYNSQTFVTSNVEWENQSNTTFTAGPTKPLELGLFIVQTVAGVPDLEAPFSITLDYTSSVNGTTVSTVTLPVLTPEPSTIVIAGFAGVLAIGLVLFRRAGSPF